MGMFDSVYFTCPECGSAEVEKQSKAGVCCCHNYDSDKVPFEIACDINGETAKCYECGAEYIIETDGQLLPPPTYKMKLRQI